MVINFKIYWNNPKEDGGKKKIKMHQQQINNKVVYLNPIITNYNHDPVICFLPNPFFVSFFLECDILKRKKNKQNSSFSHLPFTIVLLWPTLNIHWKEWCWSWSPNTWPPDVKSWLIRKDPNAGKDWGQEEKGITEDKMIGWHHQLNGHESEQVAGNGEGQRRLACYSSWGRKEQDTAERLNTTTLASFKPLG